MAVRNTLPVVTAATPSRFINIELSKLDTTVPAATIIDIIPANCAGTARLLYMVGHAAPRRESGRPRLIKAR